MRTMPRTLTLAEAVFPGRGILRDALIVLGFSWVIALFAQIAIPLPFSVVPITGQTLAVLLAGAVLGSRRGTLTVLAYMAQGAAGLPVWAPGGTMGIARLLGPTGGYIAGFLVAAFVVGWLAEHGWSRHLLTAAIAMVIGNVLIYALGLTWLARFVPADNLWMAGLIPFIPGDLLKIAVATAVLPSAWAVIHRFKS